MTAPRPRDRFPWVEERIDWVPGEPRGPNRAEHERGPRVTIREATMSDLSFLRDITRLKPRTLARFLNFNQYSVRVAVRNLRHICGLCVTKHLPDENHILHFWMNRNNYDKPVFAAKLLISAALEVPEVPTRIVVQKDDKPMHTLVENLGWTLSDIDDTTDVYRSEPWQPVKDETPRDE